MMTMRRFALVSILAFLASALCPSAEALEKRYLTAIGPQPVIRTPQGKEERLYDSSYALIIGNARYQHWDSLRNIPAELDRVTEALRQNGFDVIRLDDMTSAEMRTEINEFFQSYGRRSRKARIVFYYSGHGHLDEENDDGYLVPVDAHKSSAPNSNLLTKALPLEDVKNAAMRMTAVSGLFIFDNCYAGMVFKSDGAAPMPRPHTGSQSDRWRFLRSVSSDKSRIFIAAGTRNQILPSISPVADAFARGLMGAATVNPDGFVTASELGFFIQNHATSRSQDPRYLPLGGFTGNMVFQPQLMGNVAQPAGVERTAPLTIPTPPTIRGRPGDQTTAAMHSQPPAASASIGATASSSALSPASVRRDSLLTIAASRVYASPSGKLIYSLSERNDRRMYSVSFYSSAGKLYKNISLPGSDATSKYWYSNFAISLDDQKFAAMRWRQPRGQNRGKGSIVIFDIALGKVDKTIDLSYEGLDETAQAGPEIYFGSANIIFMVDGHSARVLSLASGAVRDLVKSDYVHVACDSPQGLLIFTKKRDNTGVGEDRFQLLRLDRSNANVSAHATFGEPAKSLYGSVTCSTELSQDVIDNWVHIWNSLRDRLKSTDDVVLNGRVIPQFSSNARVLLFDPLRRVAFVVMYVNNTSERLGSLRRMAVNTATGDIILDGPASTFYPLLPPKPTDNGFFAVWESDRISPTKVVEAYTF